MNGRRESSKAENWARRKAYLAQTKPSEVIDKPRSEFARGRNLKPKGYVRQNFIGQKHMIGDTQPMFGIDRVAFKGGEGGHNWSISGTIW